MPRPTLRAGPGAVDAGRDVGAEVEDKVEACGTQEDDEVAGLDFGAGRPGNGLLELETPDAVPHERV